MRLSGVSVIEGGKKSVEIIMYLVKFQTVDSKAHLEVRENNKSKTTKIDGFWCDKGIYD